MLVTKICPILCGLKDCSPPGSFVHKSLQERIQEWVAIPFSGHLPDSEMEPRSPALQVGSLLSEPPRKPFKQLCNGDYKVAIHITNMCSSQSPRFRPLSALQLLTLYEIEMIIISFYRWGNWETKELDNSPQVLHSYTGARIQIQEGWSQDMYSKSCTVLPPCDYLILVLSSHRKQVFCSG